MSSIKHKEDYSNTSNEEASQILQTLLQTKIITLEQIQAASSTIQNTTIHDRKKTKKQKDKKKKKKSKNPTHYMIRHIAFRFHYDGATYNGLAENRNSPTDNSVEKTLFAALEKTCLIDSEEEEKDKFDGMTSKIIVTEDNNSIRNSRNECKYSRSGRTDKGVSAFGQVIALRVRSAFPVGTLIIKDSDKVIMQESDLPNNSTTEVNCWVPSNQMKQGTSQDATIDNNSSLQQRCITEKNFCQMLNNVLPSSIRMLGWSPVSQDFSARFSTSSRTYRYFFIQRDLNLDDMQKALDNMVGEHDFRNLCKMNCEEVDNFVRVINYAKIVKTNNNHGLVDNACAHNSNGYRTSCYFEIQGQAFLWHQIRCIASILFMVGKGLESPDIVKELLDVTTNPAKPSYPFAPELPLVLHKCEYKNLEFGHAVHNLWKVSCNLELKWEELTLAAERVRNGIESLGNDSKVSTADVVSFMRVLAAERKKKLERNDGIPKCSKDYINLDGLTNLLKERNYVTWNQALAIIHNHGGGKPSAEGSKVPLHVPVMQRAKGTTYEEKIKSILSNNESYNGKLPSKRRKEAYENNIKKKKLSKKEDEMFYNRMLNEGGSGL